MLIGWSASKDKPLKDIVQGSMFHGPDHDVMMQFYVDLLSTFLQFGFWFVVNFPHISLYRDDLRSNSICILL